MESVTTNGFMAATMLPVPNCLVCIPGENLGRILRHPNFTSNRKLEIRLVPLLSGVFLIKPSMCFETLTGTSLKYS